MPVDKFGRMSDTKTRDTGVSLTYINNNYIRSDGTTTVSGSINMNGNTLYNVPDPVNPQDVATKEYADNVRGGGWINRKQDGTYAIKRDLDIDGKKLKNIHISYPINLKFCENICLDRISHKSEFGSLKVIN